MIDSLDHIIEPILKLVGRAVVAIVQIAFKMLPDILVDLFTSYADALDRRGWSPWIYFPVATILTSITIFVPIGICAAIYYIL